MSEEKYIVSALKYRPSSWDTIVGQENIAKTLQQAIEYDQLHKLIYFVVLEGLVNFHCKIIC